MEDKAYPEIVYDFEKLLDLDRYWHDLYEISIATLLGHVDGMSGQEIVIEDLHKKPAMVEALKGKKTDEVEEFDIYDIPGDRR